MVDGGLVRVANWPAALADKDVAAAIKGAVYEGYEQKAGQRVGVYRV
jgi:membrane-bound lytic murein transglycosylase